MYQCFGTRMILWNEKKEHFLFHRKTMSFSMFQGIDAKLSFVSNMPNRLVFQTCDEWVMHWFYVSLNTTWRNKVLCSVFRRYTTCSAHVRAIGRQTARRKERRTYSRRWTRTTMGSWRRKNSWRVASRTRSYRRCSLLNPDVAAFPHEPSTRNRKGHHAPHRLPHRIRRKRQNAGNNKATTETDTREHIRIIYTRHVSTTISY